MGLLTEVVPSWPAQISMSPQKLSDGHHRQEGTGLRERNSSDFRDGRHALKRGPMHQTDFAADLVRTMYPELF